MAKIAVTDKFDATVKACKVKDAWDADLAVCVVDRFDEQGKDELWHYVDDQWGATTKLCWVDEWEADLKVVFVDDQGQAGWKKPHSLQSRL